jgi:hypothetical protein
LRSTKRYDVHFSTKNSFIDSLARHIEQSANCSSNEAAECIIRGFYNKFEESFATVAIEKGVVCVRQKMD